MQKAPIRVGIIGYGYWGPNLVRNFHQHENARVTMVSDFDEKKLAQIPQNYPHVRTVRDGSELIRDPEVDAVSIATPISTHFKLAKEALEAGKHVLVEKPITATSAEARELMKIAKERNLTLMVGHTFVYTGAVQKMRELIDAGELGTLYYFDSARFNLGLIQRDSNVLWDLAPHDLSIVLHLFAERPETVQAFGQTHVGSGQEEFAFMVLRYKSGFHAHIRVSWISPVKIRMTLLGGSKKMIVYDDVEPSEKIRIYDKGVTLTPPAEEVTAFNPIYRAGDVLIPALDRTEALKRETAHFLECIETGRTPLSDGQAGLDVVRLLEAAQQSMKQNGAFVTL
jgi:predicted dehydrogenase